jgi:hypothetical protein
MARGKIEITLEQLLEAIEKTESAVQASKYLGLMYTTFIRRCKEHGVYAPNQGGKGTAKPRPRQRIPLEKIFSGEKFFGGQGLKKKLLAANLLEDKCDGCGLGPSWNGRKLTLQLDHIDGDRMNNARDNLRLLCPNCHSQTDTFSKGKLRTRACGGMADTIG